MIEVKKEWFDMKLPKKQLAKAAGDFTLLAATCDDPQDSD